MTNKAKKIIYILIQIFLVGLLLQFFLHTFITFKLGGIGTFWTFVRAWKEILILALLIFVFWLIFNIPLIRGDRGVNKNHTLNQKSFEENKISKSNPPNPPYQGGAIALRSKIKQFRKSYPLKTFLIVFIITLIVIFVISLFNANIIRFLVSIRYSMIGFFIFILAFTLSRLIFDIKDLKITNFYQKLIKRILRLSLGRRLVIWIMPGVMNKFGYEQRVYEGEVGKAPPAAYYTEYKKGLTRNQFLFERPITFGFWLVAFRPLFFIGFIRSKNKKDLILRGLLFGLVIFSTHSRAAWLAWIGQTILLLFISQKKGSWKTILYFLLPVILFILGVSFVYKDQILNRYYSDTGHLREIRRAVYLVQENILRGKGAASAGPASHQIKEVYEYNTENQYLQIRVEYGIIAFLLWMYLYLYLHWIGYKAYRKDLDESKIISKKKQKEKLNLNWLVIAFSIGLLGLSVEGLVLHSFVDRMIVYPFMLLFGIVYGVYRKNTPFVKGS